MLKKNRNEIKTKTQQQQNREKQNLFLELQESLQENMMQII